jgi:riboflavin transporter FmnP
MKTKTFNTRAMTLMALLAALSAILMSINIPLPFAPTFLKFDVAEFPGLFAGFFLGPGAAAIVIVLKNVIKLAIQGTETMYVGELMNVLGSMGFTLTASFIYKYRKDIIGARIALISAPVIGSLIAIPLNLFIAFPFYANVFGLPMEAIIGMGSAVNPLVNNMFTLILFGVVPFNLVKLSATALVTWWMYKRVGNYLRSIVYVSKKSDMPTAV